MQSSSVEIDTGLLVDPLVSLGILRDSYVVKLLLDCSCINRIEILLLLRLECLG